MQMVEHLKLKYLNPLSANPPKRSNTLKQFFAKLPTNCLSVFDHFVGLVLKGLRNHRSSNHCPTHTFSKSTKNYVALDMLVCREMRN